MPASDPSAVRVALALNSIAPARFALYTELARHFRLRIFHGGLESNRRAWGGTGGGVQGAEIKKLPGWQVRVPKKVGGRQFDVQHIHLNPTLFWELVRFSPAAVITNELGMRTAMVLLYGTLFRRPVWVWWGGTLHSERNIGRGRRFVRAILRRMARHWISYGETSTEYLTSLGVPRSSIIQVQNSVDETAYSVSIPQRELHGTNHPVILCIGQLIARKGLSQLLDAAAVLQRQGEVFVLKFVGDGPDKSALEEQAQTLGLRDVEFLPGRRPEEMRIVYASADAVIFPTLEDVWGLVANEAILSGVPVLCSKYAGCAQEFFPPECIFDPLDEADFVNKFRDLVRGKLHAVEPSRLITTEENACRITSVMRRALKLSPSEESTPSSSQVFER